LRDGKNLLEGGLDIFRRGQEFLRDEQDLFRLAENGRRRAGHLCCKHNHQLKPTIHYKEDTIMSTHVRIADRLTTQPAEQLVATAATIITGLTQNPAFSSPPVDLKTVQAAVDDLNSAIVAQAHGGPAATAEKYHKQDALIALLRQLKHYVEDHSGNDVAVVLSSGFQPALATRTRAPLDNPAILSVDLGNSGELVLKVTPIARAKCYEVRLTATGAGNVPGSWQTAGLFTNSRSMTVGHLTPGTTYTFQVRAIGGSTGYSDWSNSVSRMCAY
jgi:hypothetical protein